MKTLFVNKHGVVVQEDTKLFLTIVPPVGSLIWLDHYGFVKVTQVALAFPKTEVPTYPEALVIEVQTNTEEFSYRR